MASIVFGAGRGGARIRGTTRKVSELACEWLLEPPSGTKPWVLFVSFVTPHYPLMAPAEYFDLYDVDAMPVPKLDHRTDFQHHHLVCPTASPIKRGTRRDESTYRRCRVPRPLQFFRCDGGEQVLQTLESVGGFENTRVIYTSDHGDAGARGMWGKSNHYEEASGIPSIVAGAPMCRPVSFVGPGNAGGCPSNRHRWPSARRPRCRLFGLRSSWRDEEDPGRIAFSEYHLQSRHPVPS